MSDKKQDHYTIVHATDLMPDGQRTFDHAFALARDAGARLVTLHVTKGDAEAEAPTADEILSRLSTPDVEVAYETRIEEHKKKPKKELIRVVREIDPSLLVVGTRQQTGDKKTFRESVSEVAALDTGVPTLVVHIGQEGIVDGNGALRLRRVLLPVGDGAEARDTIEGLTEFLDQLGVDDIDIFLLRVGDGDVLDYLSLPDRSGWRWHREVRKRGYVANVVAEVCDEKDIDLIAMATRGQDGFIDVFSGTHTQKVIRRAPRPVLTVSASDKA